MLAIALTAVITVLLVRPDSSGNAPSNAVADGSKSEFASANDTGPVNIITEDPTCEAWGAVVRDLSETQKSVGWADRDGSVPASAWTPQQRTMYETAGKALTNSADTATNLAISTPHRVMRELYQQFIGFSKNFASRIPSYVSRDGDSAVVADAIASAISNMCSAIGYHAVQPIAPLVKDPASPSAVEPPATTRLLTGTDSACSAWDSLTVRFDAETTQWLALDPNIPASEWTPEQRSVNDSVTAVMTANADELENLGRKSGNPILEDFAVLAAQYRRGFVVALPNYKPADNFVAQAASFLVKTVNWSCKAAA